MAQSEAQGGQDDNRNEGVQRNSYGSDSIFDFPLLVYGQNPQQEVVKNDIEPIQNSRADLGSTRNSGNLGDYVSGNEVDVNAKIQNRLSPPLSNRAAALRTVANPLFRLARPVELGSRDGQVDRAGEIDAHGGHLPVGKPVGKQALAQQNQQHSRTEWFRYELDFRPLKTGFNVLIRKRLKWSNTRYSKMIVKRFCPQLTRKMVEQIAVGKFSKETVAALQNGGITDGFIKQLQVRIGKGNGKRRADLTEYERSLLARIESGIRPGN